MIAARLAFFTFIVSEISRVSNVHPLPFALIVITMEAEQC